MKLEHRIHQIQLAAGANEVDTTEGKIRGVKDGDLYIFRGIPYGKAKRFQAPEKVPYSDTVREAISYGAACPEYSSPLPCCESDDHPYYTIQSEDCLYLNIWTRQINPSAGQPVVVYFADQDFLTSHTVELMERRVMDLISISQAVVITVYTRLNVLGYLDLSRFDPALASSGNAGLLDRQAALAWIRENVAAFGGAPENIQIHIEAKADPAITIERTKEESQAMTDLVLEHLGLSHSEDPVSALCALCYDDLAEAAVYAQRQMSARIGHPIAFTPVQDRNLCPGHPVTRTKEGYLRGAKKDSTYIFRGIRYAKAARFHMPEAPDSWEGIKNALVYGPVCPEIETVNPDDNYTVPHVFYPQEENCQYLNVWTQSLSEEAKKPVLVWFHGGGFATGSGIEHFAYNGKALSEAEDVVVVTLNHRLNVLGYLDLSAYGEEYKYSANLGTADLVEALRWVKNNISSFGGDPANVTIFGQSGGGGKVATLLQTPSANGLFHKAVIQSGLAKFHHGQDEKSSMAAKILDNLGLNAGDVKALETIPYHKLAAAVTAIDPRAGFAFSPTRDDDFYLGDAFEVGVCEHAKTIPVMVGNVLGEFSQNFIFTAEESPAPVEGKNLWSYEKTVQILKKAFNDAAGEAETLQKAAYPSLPLANVLFTDSMFRPSTFDYLQMRANGGTHNTFGYMFSLEMPPYGGILPWHNAEIPYVFHTADAIEPSSIPNLTDKIESFVSHSWCEFARTGDPGWASYEEADHQMMYFDQECIARDSSAEEKLVRFLAEHPAELTRVVRQQAPIGFGGGPRIRTY
ncbi:MAG: carboxylesterase family protein [Lachnospiraceae bacterium]|nr:carboxylesterase family protein [Lachnospiraceae bacterium]